jgi:hypothetical protein
MRFARVSGLFVVTIQPMNCFWQVGANCAKNAFALRFRASAFRGTIP